MLLAKASFGFACAFLALLLALHLLKPEVDPAWRWISEYEIGRFGWLMRLAFFSWALSVLALAIALAPWLRSVPGVLGDWWLGAISIALVGAGVCKTDPVTHQTTSRDNVVHSICGAFVILTFPIAATLVALGLFRDLASASGMGGVLVATGLTWTGLVVFLASDIVAGRKNPSAARTANPNVRVGWQNRFMVVAYVVWILSISASAFRL